MEFSGKVRTQKHLINLIKHSADNIPNFSLLIGAGASVSSGIIASKSMIEDWRIDLYHSTEKEEDYKTWLENQEYYNQEYEYGYLFEKVYDQRSLRRIYIENIVKKGKPNWGYLYLSNLMKQNYFNVVFTPNFDDLLNEACYLYADCKPIVSAHDSTVKDIRITSLRPKIIKLHGDYLYEDLKNTIKETEDLEENMKEKFMQICREYGLIVIGYGGNDESIMKILIKMINSGSYLSNGIYWCLRHTSKISHNLRRLLKNENVYLVYIDGFDAFMAEVYHELSLPLPEILINPMQAIKNSLNNFMLPTESMLKNVIIKNDVNRLKEVLIKYEEILSGSIIIKDPNNMSPIKLKADIAFSKRNFEEAISLYNSINEYEKDLVIYTKLIHSYGYVANANPAIQIAKDVLKKYPNEELSHYYMSYAYHINEQHNLSLLYLLDNLNVIKTKFVRELFFIEISCIYILESNWDEAINYSNKGLELGLKNPHLISNQAYALKQKGALYEYLIIENQEAFESEIEIAVKNAVLGNIDEMFSGLHELISIHENYIYYIKRQKVFYDYKDDPRYDALFEDT